MTHMGTAKAIPETGPKGQRFRALTLAHADNRTRAARRSRALLAAFGTDLGGVDNLSTAERILAERAAMLAVICESHEAEWLDTGKMAPEAYVPLINALRRMLTAVGLKRRAKDVTPTLAHYLRETNAADTECEGNQ